MLLLLVGPQQGWEESWGRGGGVRVRAWEAGWGAQRERTPLRTWQGKKKPIERGKAADRDRTRVSERERNRQKRKLATRQRGRGGRERETEREERDRETDEDSERGRPAGRRPWRHRVGPAPGWAGQPGKGFSPREGRAGGPASRLVFDVPRLDPEPPGPGGQWVEIAALSELA